MSGILTLKSGEKVLIDENDLILVSHLAWRFDGRYVIRYTSVKTPDGKWKPKNIRLHRAIMIPENGMCVDHINGNPLDNRRCNLRVCTHSQNMRNQKKPKNNTSGYKGVSWNNSKSRWVVQFIINGKRIESKCFKCKIEAAKFYNTCALKYYGVFAKLNII